MLVPLSWLKDYVNIDQISVMKFCDKMIMSGSNIEEVVSFGADIQGIVVGKILEIEKHPDADKLVVTQVDVGSEVIQIVTGATNVNVGDYIPVVKHGVTLPDGTKIKRGKLRGMESSGMLCSAKELGFNDKVIPLAHKDGIFILDQAYPPGSDFAQALELVEDVVEFEITPNRPDCLSMAGMAREAAAVFGQKAVYPSTKVEKEVENTKDYIDVQIKRPDLCHRYVARVVKDVKIAQSPWWMQKRLINAGIRPINNIVDITNYVMLEYGQPLHAFDLKTVAGSKIIVDAATEGQKFTTLDGTQRTLSDGMLLINDGEKAVALAGVMGGLNSEIEDTTQTILIEAASFQGDNTRKTSKKLGLRTEASARYEKGVDPNLCNIAADRVCVLVEALGVGTVIGSSVDVYPKAFEPETVNVRCLKVNHLLGTQIDSVQMRAYLESLEMSVVMEGDLMSVTPPTVRQDLKEEIDFVEEIVRLYGYDNLPSTLPKGATQGGKDQRRRLEDMAKDSLIALGLNEIQTYSFVSPKGVDKLNVSPQSIKRRFVKLINPLGEENSVMRTTLIPNMMDVLERNYSRNIPLAHAFELGRVFLAKEENECKCQCASAGENELPAEPFYLTLGMYGPKDDFFTLKGNVEAVLLQMGISDLEFIAEENDPTYHSGRCATILCKEDVVGSIGEISSDVVEKYNLPERVYLCELNFEKVFANANIEIFYEQLPKFPAMERDIAIVVKDEITCGEIVKIIEDGAVDMLESVELFDIYKGKQVQDGYKSVAYSLRYRDKTKTLTEEAVATVHNQILQGLKEQLGAILREV